MVFALYLHRRNMNTSLIHKLFRGYIFYSPISRGKYRLAELALSLSGQPSGRIAITTKDGRKLTVDTLNDSYKYVYFTGFYEPAITKLFSQIVQPGDVCLDIGANMGWFTTLFQRLTGIKGQVHAFEPVKTTFEHLQHNVDLNGGTSNVKLNNIALGDEEKDIEIHIFNNLPDGHASMAVFGESDYKSLSARMVTLDSYLESNNIDNVRLVKMDIEGAELMMLKGASKLFEQDKLPVLEVEMALATTSGFGYLPNDLLQYIGSKGSYEFYAIDEVKGFLRQINGFEPEDIGANVLCLPTGFNKNILAKWFI